MSDLLVRNAGPEDMPAVQAIYAHHVLYGLGSFEETPPTLEEMIRRRQAIVEAGLPYLVCAAAATVVGFAYAGPYRPRPAYRYSVEDSVYVAPDFQGRGVGRTALSAVIERCTAAGYRQMVAVIGDSGNTGSIVLHEKLGFRRAGVLTAVGFKLGRWVDSVLMQRPLATGDKTLPTGA